MKPNTPEYEKELIKRLRFGIWMPVSDETILKHYAGTMRRAFVELGMRIDALKEALKEPS